MVLNTPVSPRVFKAIEKSDIEALSSCREDEIRPILPCLVRMSLIAPLDHSEECIAGRKVTLRILSGIEAVNSLVALLSIDFSALEIDVKKEQTLRQKLGVNQSESILVQSLTNGLALEFECSDPTRRLRLLLSEILLVTAQMREQRLEFYHKTSELFDNPCYLEEVSDVLCIALAELPALLVPAEVAEALLHLSNGPQLICRMIANQPDCFREVVTGLIINGEKQDEESSGGLVRLQAVRLLCQMNPSQALNVRALCVDNCVMPGLIVYVTLDANHITSNIPAETITMKGSSNSSAMETSSSIEEENDIVSFITGLLLSHDHQQRTWFAQFIKSAQRRKFDQPTSALSALRTELSDRLRSLVLFNNNETLPESQVIHATALLRLYCALKSLASLKFSEEKEISLLLQLVTCKPPPSAAGVRFVSTGLCMLIACPSLIASSENERKASEWIRWLVKEEAYFAGAIGVSSSFGAMLLLMAIHFLVQQLSAIIDLVSAALGMKVVTRAANLNRIKHIFTHDVFTEQVVTAHAVKVPVTQGLNANIPGFLPVHCIYHQLKSRMFTKHKVPIKDWIYKQICNSTLPLHPMMPQLIEVFVNSILVFPTKGTFELFNEPITEEEIMSVFSLSTFKDKTFSQYKARQKNKSSASRIKLRSLSSCKAKLFDQSSWNDQPVPVTSITKDKNKFSHITAINVIKKTSEAQVESVMTSQLLLLYYLLLYEDLRLTNTIALAQANKKAHTYSPYMFAQLPIRYLLSSAQKEQKMYAGMFCSLLKLLVTHYPQLCLVEDWLYQQPAANSHLAILPPELPLNSSSLTLALEEAVDNPGRLLILLDKMIRLPPHRLWPLAQAFTSSIRCLLKPGIPRRVLDMYRLEWLRLNSLFPRRLWAMTVEALRPDSYLQGIHKPLSEDDIVLDPLYVLRCDQRVFRCAPILQIVIYILQVYLLSSQTYLNQHIQNNPLTMAHKNAVVDHTSSVNFSNFEEEREKLNWALVLAQESSSIQILIETAKVDPKSDNSKLAVQEVQSIICSFLHQAFIKDTTLAKLVHFQGYPKELIGPLVRGVPSMHIAVSWIPELLQLPDLEKQMFAVELTSHLALQNAMPPTLSISRLGVNTLATLVSVMGKDERLFIMKASLESLVRIGRAFPALQDDLVHLLVTYGRIAAAQSALISAPSPRTIGFIDPIEDMDFELGNDVKPSSGKLKHNENDAVLIPIEDQLCKKIISTFRELVEETAMTLDLY